MIQSRGGKFCRTRNIMKRNIRDKSKIKISNFLQTFKEGEKVVIVPDPSYQKGLPFRRFWGRTGSIIGKRGKASIVEVKDGGKLKKVLSANVHLKKVKK